ncbi:MAG: sigma-70 family RNA polymerase sigma factor [Elusimicrobiota bacterium]
MDSNGKVLKKFNDETIKQYRPLIKSIARKYHNSGEPLEDLEQIAYLGLINALNLFDKKRGVKFETYATWLINGEIRHYIRDKHTIVNIPHWVKEYNRKIDKYTENFRQENNRFPTVSEIADYFNITEEGLNEILKGRDSVQVISLDSSVRQEEENHVPVLEQVRSKGYRSFQLPIEDIIQLKSAFNTLKKIQKDVIYYLFVKDLTQTSTAKKMGLTQRQVSRVKQSALEDLKKNL